VAWSLAKFGRDASVALPALRDQMTHPDATARRRVAIAIWQIAPESGFPANVLLANMKNAWFQERYQAAEEMRGHSSLYDQQVVQTFIELIRLGPVRQPGMSGIAQWHRWESARQLGEMGATAREALPLLREMENDGDAMVRKAATEARQKIEKSLATAAETDPGKTPPR